MMTSPNLGCFAPHGDLARVMREYNEAAESSQTGRGEVMVLRRVFIDHTEAAALRQFENVYRHWSYYMSQFNASPTRVADRFDERTENEAIVVKRGEITPAEIEVERDDVYRRYDDPILTSPDRAIERFRHYESLGVDHITTLTAFGADVSEVIRSMEIMSREVFPAFKERHTHHDARPVAK